MVKNTKGGNKTKKQKRGYQKKTMLTSTEVGQMYAQVVENRGDHFAVLCADNVLRMGKLSGAAKRGQRLLYGYFVIVSVRDYETDQKNCDIIGAAIPTAEIRNIFRKINPIAGDNDNIEFYTQDDKFNEFEESEITIQQTHIKNENNENNENNEKKENNENDVFSGEGDEIYRDPKAKYEEYIDWSDL